MIGRIKGILIHKEPPTLLIDVGGIGYEIQAPMTTFYNLPAPGNEVVLHTHLVLREDAHLLFGFDSEKQRRLFRILIKVNGVGPRIALALLSGLNDTELTQCVQNNEVDRLTQIPGIGRKTAERLMMEMRDKLNAAPPENPSEQTETAMLNPVNEAVSALTALGYKTSEANRAIQEVPADAIGSVEEIIRQALRKLAKST